MALLDLRGEILRFACQVEGTHLQGSGGGGLLSGRRKGGEGYTWGRGQGRAVTAATFWQAGGRSSVLPRRVGPSSQGRCLVRSVGVSGEGWGGRGARGKGTGRGAGCGGWRERARDGHRLRRARERRPPPNALGHGASTAYAHAGGPMLWSAVVSWRVSPAWLAASAR